jgi:hypothetical protein
MKPVVGLEPTALALQERCSTTELHRHLNSYILPQVVNIPRPFPSNNYNFLMFAWYIDTKEAFSVYLDSARAGP